MTVSLPNGVRGTLTKDPERTNTPWDLGCLHGCTGGSGLGWSHCTHLKLRMMSTMKVPSTIRFQFSHTCQPVTPMLAAKEASKAISRGTVSPQ